MSEPFQHPYATAHVGWGPVGPLLGVLSVILVLGAAAVFIGRLCAGRSVLGYGHYDVEGWIEAKCSSCIDGRLDPPPPPPPAVPIVIPIDMPPPPAAKQPAGVGDS